MRCYVIYSLENGRVSSAGSTPDDMLTDQPIEDGYGRLIVPTVPVDPSRCYVIDNQLVEADP